MYLEYNKIPIVEKSLTEKQKILASRIPSQILQEVIGKKIEDMTHNDLMKVSKVYNVKKESGLTEKQRELMTKFSPDLIREITKKDMEDLNYYDYKRFLNVVNMSNDTRLGIYDHPVISTIDYEYGWQESVKCQDNKLYYIVFYDLCMIDIDDKNVDIDQIQDILIEKGYSGRIYTTYNGYHIFITSHLINHRSWEARKIMEIIKCDAYYKFFTYRSGFRVRLNPKLRENETVAAAFLKRFGEKENPILVDLLYKHDILLEQHKI